SPPGFAHPAAPLVHGPLTRYSDGPVRPTRRGPGQPGEAFSRPVSTDVTAISPLPPKTQENPGKHGFSHFTASRRNVPKRPEMRASGSKYSRPRFSLAEDGRTDPVFRPVHPKGTLRRRTRLSGAVGSVPATSRASRRGSSTPPARLARRSASGLGIARKRRCG